MRRLGIIVLVLAAAACSGNDYTALVASAPGSIGTGRQRVIVAVLDPQTNQFVTSPDVTPVATLRDDIGSPLGEYTGEFFWAIPDVSGMYAFYPEIPGAATFQLTIDAGDLGDLGPVGLVAVEDLAQVEIGEQAPRSDTRTLDDAPLEDLTSDPDPDPTFYEMTVAEAIDAGPSVIVFATPAWCTSRTCGPMLDRVKAVAGDYPGLNFVHVEIYQNIHVTDPNDLVLAPGVAEWGIPSEPWLYVVDGSGTVTARFEGGVSDSELTTALDAVAS